jgi:hypothetical protein
MNEGGVRAVPPPRNFFGPYLVCTPHPDPGRKEPKKAPKKPKKKPKKPSNESGKSTLFRQIRCLTALYNDFNYSFSIILFLGKKSCIKNGVHI